VPSPGASTAPAWANRIVGSGEEAPDQLLAHPDNWRVHPKAQQEALAGVLDQVGWVGQVLVNQRTGHVVDGHLRVALAISRGESSVPVLYVDLSPEDEALVLASLDPLAAMATTDEAKLRELLAEVSVDSEALAAMLASLVPTEPRDGLTDPDEVPEPPDEAVTKPGDLWLLGDHRLLCGDAGSADDLDRLLDGEQVSLLATDPPYNVKVEPRSNNAIAAGLSSFSAAGRSAIKAGCGKYLFGDVGRYRHPPPTCEAFLAAKPVVRRQRRGSQDQIDTRIKGNSYPKEWYEDAVGELLGHIGSLDDHTMTEVVRLYGEDLAKPDELTLARIERERDEASQRLAKTRDIAAWQATMARLDAESAVARQPRQHQRMAPDEVVTYLRSLPSLWNDAGPEGRQALASALFAKLEVEGYQKMRYELTPDARDLGLDAALPAELEVGAQIGGFGRGERGSASLTHLRVRPRFVLENVTRPRRLCPVEERKAG
jgi:hypothetical protein